MHNIGRNDNAVFEKKIQKILGIIYFLKTLRHDFEHDEHGKHDLGIKMMFSSHANFNQHYFI